MTTLPVADARAQFSKLVEDAERTHHRYEITRNGHRAAVLLGADDFDALQETIAILSDPVLLAEHRQAEADIDVGDYVSADELSEAMRAAGRLPS
jgi:antitoxin YefM